MGGSPLTIHTRAVEPFYKNGYVVACADTREGILIDPGDEVGELLAAVRQQQLDIKYILLTHAHLDHITGVGTAKAALGAPVGLHEADNFLYKAVVQQGRAFGFDVREQPPVDFFYDLRTPLAFGRYSVWIQHTPGHCPGGVCLAVGAAEDPVRTLFVGDTLFSGSIGRTDLPGGDMATLIRSIREVLLAYPDETVVHSGHGPATTIGRERTTNPFLI